MSQDFLVTVTGAERRATFEQVFGSGTVYVKSPVPSVATLPNFASPQLVYELDVAMLTSEQRRNLIRFLSERFNLAPSDVERDLDATGMPILAEGCLVTVLRPLWGVV